MRNRKALGLTGAAALLALTAGPWSGSATATDVPYVSGPGGAFSNYTVPAIVIRAGDTITYTNVDVAPHDIVAETAIGPDEPWCAQAGFKPGQCPLVWSPLVGLGQSTAVYGLNNLKPGDQVVFKCTLHANMQGTIFVSPA